jgi:hypothetical protein
VKEHFAEMVGGPGAFRFILQPTVAIVLGVLHGLRDHRGGKRPYIVGLVGARQGRWRLLGEALREIGVPLAVAVAASYAFQYIIRSRINLAYGLLFAAAFVALPYAVTRGLANRFAPSPP